MEPRQDDGAGLMSRRRLLRASVFAGVGAAGLTALAGCGETQVVEVIKEVPVEKVVEKVKEVAVVEEKVVTKIVEVEKAQRETQRMVFLHFFTGDLWKLMFDPLTKDFTAKFPWIQWFGVHSSYGQLPAKLVTMAAGGQPPDGSSIDNNSIQEMIARGLLENLDPWIEQSNIDFMDDLIPARVEQQRGPDGGLYALPEDLGSAAIFLNKPLFAEKGVELPDGSWSYEDIVETAKKLTFDKTGNNVAASGFDPDNIDTFGFYFQKNLYGFYDMTHGYNGMEYFDFEFTKTRFTEPDSIAALQFFADMIHKEHVALSPAAFDVLKAGGVSPFTTGKIGFGHFGTGLNGVLHRENSQLKDYEVTNVPTTPTTTVTTGGQGFVITKAGKAKEAAWEWTKFIAEAENQKFMALNGRWTPIRMSVASFAAPKDGIPKNFVTAFFDQALEHGFAPYWSKPGWAEIRNAIQAEIDPLWSGESDAAEVAEQVQRVGDPLIKQRPTTFN